MNFTTKRCGAPDLIDRAARDPRAEQLLTKLHRVAARDAVAHRQRRDRRLQARAERTRGDLAGALRSAPRTAQPLTAMLGHPDRQLGQLLDLVAGRLGDRDQLGLAEHVPATAASRPVLDDLVDRRHRQQLPSVALMTGLAARLAPGAILAPPRCRAGRVRARRLRRVARVSLKLTLELLHPRLQLLDPPIHAQQHLDDNLASRVIDRLRLSPLHTPKFDSAELCPPTH